jgi:hypothetical protein
MLSVEDTRRLLGDDVGSDAEAAEIRDAFRILGDIIFEQWRSEKKVSVEDFRPSE